MLILFFLARRKIMEKNGNLTEEQLRILEETEKELTKQEVKKEQFKK